MRLTLDPSVGAAWAVAGGRAAAIVLGDDDPTARLAARLGVAEVELVALRMPAGAADATGHADATGRAAVPGAGDLAGDELTAVLRQWVHQAAGGAGRGVALTVAGLPDGPLTLTVTSWDSSARELCMRLASPQEPALPALRALLGTEVTVVDGEDA